ncbi:MAG: hypothetical protein ACREQ5_02190 [Candidatus Dormibacteria bacterium]
MLLVAESIYEGTWSSGPPPPEIVDFELCYAMNLSWQDYQQTPLYVRRVWWDLLQARREAENDRHDREMARHGR